MAVAGLLGALSPVHAAPSVWQATVEHVSDGDTVYVRRPGDARARPVRLLGLDAPEICQRFGTESRDALEGQVLGRQVTFKSVGEDRYGRTLAQLFWQGQDVNRWMVSQGWAWSYARGDDPGLYGREQRQARTLRLGLFAEAQRPETPWSFRRRHGRCHTGS